MSLALYRKYRPQTFVEVTNQNHVKITLGNEIATGRIAHAYVFAGPRGVGKTTIARLFAKAVNCAARKNGSPEPCNTCASCVEITSGGAIDTIEIDAATHTGVDSVRENIVENARFSPTKSRYKVFIIDEAHMLSGSSWNALLKTLEEPPAHALFILATTEVHKVPDTILSRCQRFDFHKLAADAIVERLKMVAAGEAVNVDREVLTMVARQAGGSIRDAESLLGQIFALGEKRVTVEVASLVLPHSDTGLVLDLLEAISRGDVARGFEIMHRTVEEGIDSIQFTNEIVEILRHILVRKVGSAALVGEFDDATAGRVHKLAETMTVPFTVRAIEAMLAAREGLRRAEIPELPIEIAIITLGMERSGPSAPQTAPRPAALSLPPRPKANVQLEEVKAVWPQIVSKVAETSPALPFVLNLAAPVEIRDGVLVLAVQYALHVGKINDPKTQSVLEGAMQAILRVDLPVVAEIGAGVVASSGAPDPSLDAALDILGVHSS